MKNYCFYGLVLGFLVLGLGSCGQNDRNQDREPVDRPPRAELRAFHGAPPVIPHAVAALGREDCQLCHGPGQQTAGRVVAPVTPHPQWTQCNQCHVERLGDDLFVANHLMALAEPEKLATPSPFLPPRIPHRLDNLRGQSCQTCHIGPGAPLAQRPAHGNRANCQQCHVPGWPETNGYQAAVVPFEPGAGAVHR